MGSKKKKSKEQLYASLLEKYTFFIDRSLGKNIISRAFEEQGIRHILHDDHFSQDTTDTEWMDTLKDKDWVVLTKDVRIRKKHDEKSVLFESGLAAFFLNSGQMRGHDMAQAFIQAMPKMLRILEKTQRPFIATVNRDGRVALDKKKNL